MKFHQKPVSYVSDIHLYVSDLTRSIAFYESVIGFKVMKESEQRATLTADGKTPLVTIEQPNEVTPRNQHNTGLFHFALLLPTRADLAKALIHLVKSQYPLQGASDHLVSEALYLADPDGNGIEIYADRPDETWNWHNGEVEMATIALDAQGLVDEDDGTPWQGLPPATVMGHIHLQVSELENTYEFYCKGLGLDLVTKYGNQALFISSGAYHHHIGLNTWVSQGGEKPVETSVGLKWYTLVLPSDDDLSKTISLLKEVNAPVNDKDGYIQTEDPSGNVIHLVVK
ncbi:VOC family protein [Bacillus carboniphilus]|uniref:VOC family protein n=1 Tax=Bacillus carboniphilus TaxID=86663 RepID=A0ABP3FDR1_9BACI